MLNYRLSDFCSIKFSFVRYNSSRNNHVNNLSVCNNTCIVFISGFDYVKFIPLKLELCGNLESVCARLNVKLTRTIKAIRIRSRLHITITPAATVPVTSIHWDNRHHCLRNRNPFKGALSPLIAMRRNFIKFVY